MSFESWDAGSWVRILKDDEEEEIDAYKEEDERRPTSISSATEDPYPQADRIKDKQNEIDRLNEAISSADRDEIEQNPRYARIKEAHKKELQDKRQGQVEQPSDTGGRLQDRARNSERGEIADKVKEELEGELEEEKKKPSSKEKKDQEALARYEEMFGTGGEYEGENVDPDITMAQAAREGRSELPVKRYQQAKQAVKDVGGEWAKTRPGKLAVGAKNIVTGGGEGPRQGDPKFGRTGYSKYDYPKELATVGATAGYKAGKAGATAGYKAGKAGYEAGKRNIKESASELAPLMYEASDKIKETASDASDKVKETWQTQLENRKAKKAEKEAQRAAEKEKREKAEAAAEATRLANENVTLPGGQLGQTAEEMGFVPPETPAPTQQRPEKLGEIADVTPLMWQKVLLDTASIRADVLAGKDPQNKQEVSGNIDFYLKHGKDIPPEQKEGLETWQLYLQRT